MAPNNLVIWSQNELLADLLSIWVDLLAILTDAKSHEILKALQKAKKTRKIAQGSPTGVKPGPE